MPANEAAAPNDDGSMMLLLAIVGGVAGVCVVIAAIAIITSIVIVVLRTREKAREESALAESHASEPRDRMSDFNNPMSKRSSVVKTRPMLIDRMSATPAMLEQFDAVNIELEDIDINMEDVIGEGAFGKVYGAKLRRGGIDHIAFA